MKGPARFEPAAHVVHGNRLYGHAIEGHRLTVRQADRARYIGRHRRRYDDLRGRRLDESERFRGEVILVVMRDEDERRFGQSDVTKGPHGSRRRRGSRRPWRRVGRHTDGGQCPIESRIDQHDRTLVDDLKRRVRDGHDGYVAVASGQRVARRLSRGASGTAQKNRRHAHGSNVHVDSCAGYS